MIYGAIAGDIIGSRFEFDRPNWKREFDLFTEESICTDDTVMTIAVALAVTSVSVDADEQQIKDAAIHYMRRLGRAIPNAGYGARFINWIWADDPQPYGSFGNGSAMRTSSIGWLYDDLDRTRKVAKWVAEVSHNHPEGIKGAECTASVIWLARNNFSKDDIMTYVVEEFGYDLSKTVDELRPLHEHVETCMDSMPKALAAFYEGDSYEEVIRNAISLGGDTDTLGAIAGAMAEAMYQIPSEIINKCNKILGHDLSLIVEGLDRRIALGV